MNQLTLLAKKTKASILQEYEELLKKHEELKQKSQEVNQPENIELSQKAKQEWTIEKAAQMAQMFKKQLNDQIDVMSNQLNGSISKLQKDIVIETERWTELQKVTELTKKELEVNRGIKLTAETLELAMNGYELKKIELEKELNEKKKRLEEEIASHKKDWQREEEEYNYNIKITREKEMAVWQESKAVKEKELEQREQILKKLEDELMSLRKQSEEMPAKIEQLLKTREKEVSEKLRMEFDIQLKMLEKDRQAEKTLLENQIKNLTEKNVNLTEEIRIARVEMKEAKEQSHKLAVKVIESGSYREKKVVEENSQREAGEK